MWDLIPGGRGPGRRGPGARVRSLGKAWYPVVRVFIGFDAARIEFDPGAATFHAQLLVFGRSAGSPGCGVPSGA